MSRHFDNKDVNMRLYIAENYKDMFPYLKGRDLTERLLKEALEDCGVKGAHIIRDKNGKPHTDKSGVFISASHSGIYFICAVGSDTVGIDIQKQRPINIDKISKRYFDQKEQEYIRSKGDKGFFEIWTRKEAYAKYTGNGLKDIIAGEPVIGRKDVGFFDFQIGNGMFVSCCFSKD